MLGEQPMYPDKEVCVADKGAVSRAGVGTLLQRIPRDCGKDVPGCLERQAASGLRPDHLPLRRWQGGQQAQVVRYFPEPQTMSN